MSTVEVRTESGPVAGVALPSGMRLFAGIPFAEPPVGGLRFEAPVQVTPWSEVRPATAFAPDPIQQKPEANSLMAAAMAKSAGFSEDCLYLNVWSPADSVDKPVFVWIFGGGFEGGSASPPLAPGEALAAALDCVIVSIAYRVGALGFLHLGGTSTNQGLQDQLLALQWVHRNVDAFGGDPSRVTVAGVSAGAFSIGSLLSLSSTAGLFQQAILMSGSTQRIYPTSAAAELAADLLAAAGVSDVAGLRALDPDALLLAQRSVGQTDIGQRNLPGGKTWGIVLDGEVLPRHPHDAVVEGCARDIRLLIGSCADEVNMWAVSQAATFAPTSEEALLAEMSSAGRKEPASELDAYRARIAATGRTPDLSSLRAAFLTDEIYGSPARELAHAHTRSGGETYLYEFADAPMGPAMGAFHGIDALYLMGVLALVGVSDPARMAVQGELTSAFRAFVHGDAPWQRHADGAPAHTIGG